MLKIIVAHPDKEAGAGIVAHLNAQSFQSTLSTTGKDAQKLLSTQNFYAAILHMEIKDHSGYELLNYIKANRPSLRIVITCSATNALLKDDEVMENLVKLGILGVWRPPFALEDLSKIVDSSQNLSFILSKITKQEGQKAEEDVEAKNDDFTSIRIDDFFSGSTVLFDTFVKIGENKYIKILHSGDSFAEERLAKYRQKTEVLYFKSEDRRKYLKILDVLLKKVGKRDDIDDGTKVVMMKNMAQKYVEEISSFGLAPQLLDMGQSLVESMVETVRASPNLIQSLQQMKDFDPTLYSHAYLVSMFSSLVAMQFQWSSPKTLQTLAMASLFHDLGKLDFPKELIGTEVKDLSPENALKYWDHPYMVSRKLSDSKLVDSNVLQIIQQHHEYMDGTGFPKGLKGQKIHPLSRIIVLVNDFCNYLVPRNITPFDAITEML